LALKLREYVLLRGYQENIITRGFLLRIPFVALEQVENNSWYQAIPDNEKPRVRSIIQIDIISKIMMYIEDLAILSKSFELNKDFYELIIDNTIDIGAKTGQFIENITSISDKKIMQYMSYADITETALEADYKFTELFRRHIDYHVGKVKAALTQIASFSKSNFLVHKRFKHAGMPILSNSFQVPPPSGPFSVFEVFNIIAAGPNP
jgi:hypothetical protein